MGLISHFLSPVPEGQHELIIPDESGHTTMSWGSPAATATVDEVRQVFNEIVTQGYAAYAEAADRELSVIREFDETAARIVLSAPLVGG